mgnify:FL=1
MRQQPTKPTSRKLIEANGKSKLVLRCLSATALLLLMLLVVSCAADKSLADGDYLLHRVKVVSDRQEVDASRLRPYVRQVPHSRLFGRKKVVYDSLLTARTRTDLTNAMQNMGYLDATLDVETQQHNRRIDVSYLLHPGEPYFVRDISYDIQDERVAQILRLDQPENQVLREGIRFSVDQLESERKRITKLLNDQGFYKFHKDYISFSVDSLYGSRLLDVTMHLHPYFDRNDADVVTHPLYTINRVNFVSGDDGKIHLRQKVLRENTRIEEGKPYSSSDLQKTYNLFGRLSAVRFTSVKFSELPDTTLLDCQVQVSVNKPNSISFQPEGTNTAGNLGAAASLTYQNRNLFRGAETFSVQLRGAFEAITGLEGYQNEDYEEYSLESKLEFPRFILPFVSKSYRKRSTATSELSVSYNLQNRPEFQRRLFNAAWRYRWTDASKHTTYRADIIDLNYINMPWISATFKHDYLDSVSNRNAILRYNYEDLFIMKIGFSMSRVFGNNAYKLNVETAGNLLKATSLLLNKKENENGQYTLFGIAYAQYAKADFDFTHVHRFNPENELVMHAGLGIAYPYGNSRVLPFEKRYFSGGANSVRGWNVRGLGPGKFRGTNGAIDFINQTGDMKLDLNAEYRTNLFWKLRGALFVDAGNIWTLRAYEEQPGGQFRWDEFYKQIAVAYGVGVRLNFDYFVLRFDMGMKAINPAYETRQEHYAIIHPRLSRDFVFHFAVGLPF